MKGARRRSPLNASPAAPPPALDERVVIAGIRRGSTAAFEELFRAHHPGMCAFAARMVGRNDVAEDLVQEVFLYIWRHHESWDVQRSARTYLYSSVRHAAPTGTPATRRSRPSPPARSRRRSGGW